jgi:hypothetical protein
VEVKVLQWRIQFEQLTNDSQDNNHFIVDLRTSSGGIRREQSSQLTPKCPTAFPEKKVALLTSVTVLDQKQKNCYVNNTNTSTKLFPLCTLGQVTSFFPSSLILFAKPLGHIRVAREISTINFMLSPINVMYCVN